MSTKKNTRDFFRRIENKRWGNMIHFGEGMVQFD